MIKDRTLRAITGGALAALIGSGLAGGALAHHGWAWTTGGDVELTGVIREARLGNPHGELEVEAEDGTWIVEVGQPWRNARAGLTDDMLSPGTEIAAIGEPSADVGERLLKAESVRIGGELYELYPGRD